MAVPKKRTSTARRGKRRAGQTHKLYKIETSVCPTTKELTLPHRVSPSGFYKGVKIFTSKADKRAAKAAAAETAAE
jgi:large subunit ribosomal protein L32